MPVSVDPPVDLFLAHTDGPADHTLLMIHGGPDRDHSYSREPPAGRPGRHRLLLPDLACLQRVRFSAEWLRPLRAGTLPRPAATTRQPGRPPWIAAVGEFLT